MHKLSDEELRGLVIEETGAADDSSAVPLMLACIKHLKKFAKWDSTTSMPRGDEESVPNVHERPDRSLTSKGLSQQGLGLSLGFTINLNLPSTSDPEVFNAIFRALKEHLLRGPDA